MKGWGILQWVKIFKYQITKYMPKLSGYSIVKNIYLKL